MPFERSMKGSSLGELSPVAIATLGAAVVAAVSAAYAASAVSSRAARDQVDDDVDDNGDDNGDGDGAPPMIAGLPSLRSLLVGRLDDIARRLDLITEALKKSSIVENNEGGGGGGRDVAAVLAKSDEHERKPSPPPAEIVVGDVEGNSSRRPRHMKSKEEEDEEEEGEYDERFPVKTVWGSVVTSQGEVGLGGGGDDGGGAEAAGGKHNDNDDDDGSKSAKPSSSKPASNPVPIVLISDPGQDLDDEMMFIMARHLQNLNYISLEGVVANLHPSFARARLTRGTLDLLGMHRVPVGIGSDGGDVKGKHSSDQFESTASSYIVHDDGEAARGLESGLRLLQRLYEAAPEIEYEDLPPQHQNQHLRFQEEEGDGGGGGQPPQGEDEGPPSRKLGLDWSGRESDQHTSNKCSLFKPKPLPVGRKIVSGGLVMVVTSSMKDAAIFVRDNPTLFASKTREVVVMGGCLPIEVAESEPELEAIQEANEANHASSSSLIGNAFDIEGDSESEYDEAAAAANKWKMLSQIEAEPDTANNNTFDPAAASFFYSQCQNLGVTFTCVSRFAAYAAKMPRSVYDELALTGSSIGWRLRNSQRASIDQLWQRACSKDPAGRQGLPARCDRRWFIETFCGGNDDESRCCADTAWDLVTGFMQYDTIALLAAVPGLREKYFSPVVLPPLEGAVEYFDDAGGGDATEKVVSAATDEAEAETEIEIPDRRAILHRSSSDPGPGFIQRAIAHADEDNKKLETVEVPLHAQRPKCGPSAPVAFERGTRNLIGLTAENHNLKEPLEVVDLLKTGYRAGILCNHHTHPHIILCLQMRWDNLADTLLTCLMLRSLWDMRLASVLGVVVSILPSDKGNGKPAEDSSEEESEGSAQGLSPDQSPSTLKALAETIRNTLCSIGLSHVKYVVVAGTTLETHKKLSAEALLNLYESAPPIGVTLVLTSTFTSVWPFVEAHPDLFRDKTVRVVHTGGALIWPARRGWASLPLSPMVQPHDDDVDNSSDDLSSILTEEKILVPDPAAQNNRLDISSARLFYKRTQALSVPMVVLSRHVAKECCIPRNFFDVLGSHGGVVGQKISESEKSSLMNLYRCACAPFGSPGRGNLPERCDRHWFAETFCAGKEGESEEDVWLSVEAVNLYSPIALVAALPGETVKNYFQTMPFTVRSATHLVVGLTEEVPPRNVKNPSELRSLVVQSLLSAALANESEFGTGPPPLVPIRMDHEKNSRSRRSRQRSSSSESHTSMGASFSEASDSDKNEDSWSFSEAARREIFSRTVFSTSKNLVMPKSKQRRFVSLQRRSQIEALNGFTPPSVTEGNRHPRIARRRSAGPGS